jgi:hypothetical protein
MPPGQPIPSFFYDAGVEAGAEASSPAAQDVIVVLDFNKPALVDTPYDRYWGTRLFLSHTFVTTDDIRKASVLFAQGFVKGAASSGARLWLAIGTNNFQADATRELSAEEFRQHGGHWGVLVEQVRTDLQQYAGTVFVEGANDIEFAWSDSEHAIAWVEGYRDANQFFDHILYNYGSCDGCYPDCGSCTLENNNEVGGYDEAGNHYIWSRADAIYAVHGVGNVRQLPEIYYPSPCLSSPNCPPGQVRATEQAKQWANLSLYTASHVINGTCYRSLDFAGALTGWRRAGMNSTTYAPADGWDELWSKINSNSCTSQSLLQWSADIEEQRQH